MRSTITLAGLATVATGLACLGPVASRPKTPSTEQPQHTEVSVVVAPASGVAQQLAELDQQLAEYAGLRALINSARDPHSPLLDDSLLASHPSYLGMLQGDRSAFLRDACLRGGFDRVTVLRLVPDQSNGLLNKAAIRHESPLLLGGVMVSE